MRTYDFSPLWRSTVGFERLFDLINNEAPNIQDTYPPYDIVRTGEESYRITLAVAGFTPEQVSIVAHQNLLTVKCHQGRERQARLHFPKHRGTAVRAEVQPRGPC